MKTGTQVHANACARVVELWYDGRCVARHERCYSRQQQILDPEHYLNVLYRSLAHWPDRDRHQQLVIFRGPDASLRLSCMTLLFITPRRFYPGGLSSLPGLSELWELRQLREESEKLILIRSLAPDQVNCYDSRPSQIPFAVDEAGLFGGCRSAA